MTDNTKNINNKKVANIAVVGAGWWSQGWHLPALKNNPAANLIAIVDTSPHPQSSLNPDLEPLDVLKEKYDTKIFASVQDMLQDEAVGPDLDGVLIATPHATHYQVCQDVMVEIDRRTKEQGIKDHPPLHILMEKPMSTDVHDSMELYKLVQTHAGKSQFWVNHSANFRAQSKLARQTISSGRLGRIRHVTGSFASPLKWIFEVPANQGWNEPTGNMLGNGFAWGQSSHLFAFLFHLCPDLQPLDVYCIMTHSEMTGADISHSATIRCIDHNNNKEESFSNKEQQQQQQHVVMNVSGTTLLPGNAHSDPPVAKMVHVEIYGDQGSLHYSGNDRDPSSGRLEVRNADGSVEVLHESFEFENLDNAGCGPESLQNFVQLCCGGDETIYCGADVTDGLRSIQTIDAMYRSNASHQPEKVLQV